MKLRSLESRNLIPFFILGYWNCENKPCGLPFRQNRKIKYQEGMLILVLEFWTMLYQKRSKKGEASGEIWTLDPWFTRPVL